MNKNLSMGLRAGVIGEQVAWDILIHMPYVRQVIDVRDDKRFQVDDVDFLVETTNRQFVWIEVKTDYKAYRTGNIVYENESSTNVHSAGCFAKTKAAQIMYFVVNDDKTDGTMYCIRVIPLRQYVEQFADKLPPTKMGDNAEGYLIKINELIKRGIMKEVKRYEDTG